MKRGCFRRADKKEVVTSLTTRRSTHSARLTLVPVLAFSVYIEHKKETKRDTLQTPAGIVIDAFIWLPLGAPLLGCKQRWHCFLRSCSHGPGVEKKKTIRWTHLFNIAFWPPSFTKYSVHPTLDLFNLFFLSTNTPSIQRTHYFAN